MGLVVMVIVVCMYLLPLLIAVKRKVINKTGIVILNVLLGWTLIGWVGALIWASSAKTIKDMKKSELWMS